MMTGYYNSKLSYANLNGNINLHIRYVEVGTSVTIKDNQTYATHIGNDMKDSDKRSSRFSIV